MSELHFNLQTIASYRRDKVRRGYNPFDYPEEWKFFTHPFEMDEEDDILTNLLFQIRKMTRRLHLFFEAPDNHRMETAFYFGLLDSLAEADDYLLGALKYARYCRLEKLFFLSAHEELGAFLEKMGRLYDELLLKIRSFGETTFELNRECNECDLFLLQYCYLTQHGIPDDLMRALLRAPGFPSTQDNKMIFDEKTNFWSYAENLKLSVEMVDDESNIEGACDSSGLEKMLEPVDMLLCNIRGTLLWVVIQKIKCVRINAAAIACRHDKLVETMCQEAYKEVCSLYARSQVYARKRNEELPQLCADETFLQVRKPTEDEVRLYFNTHYRDLILSHNKSYQLFRQYRKQEKTFCIEFLNFLLNESTREDAEEFLFFQTFGNELSAKHAQSDMHYHPSASDSSVNGSLQKSINILEVEKLVAKELIIDGGGHPHFPECLSVENAQNLYEFLSQEGFIDKNKTPLLDFNYLMGASTQYTTPEGPKKIYWLKNKQMLREMIILTFAPLLENGTKKSYLEQLVPNCFVDKNGKLLELAKNDERQVVHQEIESLKQFFATISRPEIHA